MAKEDVIEMDPDFALGYTGLANTYLQFAFWQRASKKEIVPKALKPALKALELDNELEECYATLGELHIFQYEFETAQIYLEKALELNPNYPPAMDWLAWLYLFKQDGETGLKWLDRAILLDPLSSRYRGSKGLALITLGRLDDCFSFLQGTLKKYPEDNYVMWVLANYYSIMGDYDMAIETFQKRTAGTYTNWCLGYTYGIAGRTEEAKKVLDYHLTKLEDEYVPPMMIGFIYLGLGDVDSALKWVEQELKAGIHLYLVLPISTDPRWAPLFNDVRFQKLWNDIGMNQ